MRDNMQKNNPEQYEAMAVSILLDDFAELDVGETVEEFHEGEEEDASYIPDTLAQHYRRRMHRAVSAQRGKRLLKRALQVTGKAAMFLLLFVGLASTLVLSVEALRVPAFSFLLEKFDLYSVVHIQNNGEPEAPQPDDIASRLALAVPEGYELTQSQINSDGSGYITYMKSEGDWISIFISSDNQQAVIDSEFGANSKYVVINGCKALFAEKRGYHLIWTNPEKPFLYNIHARALSEDEFWEMVRKLV